MRGTGFAMVCATVLAACAPAGPAPNAQLTASVQTRMDLLGFGSVDVDALSNKKVAALHLALRGRYLGGLNRMRKQQEVKTILDWPDTA